MKKPRYKKFTFSLESLANFICEYIQDGERTKKRDVLDWWKWFEKRCGVTKPYITGPWRIRLFVSYPAGAKEKRATQKKRGRRVQID